MAVFEESLSKTLNECLAIGGQRGQEYADTWTPENLVSTYTASVLGIIGSDRRPEALRLIQLASLVDVKASRIASGGPYKRDSWIDGLNYAAVLCDLLEQYVTSRT